MPATPPPVALGGPEIFMVVLASVIIFALVGPKFLRERAKAAAEPKM